MAVGPSGLEQGADQVYEKSSHLTPYKETPKFFCTPIRHPKMQTCYSLAANKHARHSFQAPLVRPAGMLALPHSTFTPGRADGDATMRQGSVGLDTQASGSLASSLLSHVHRVPLVSAQPPAHTSQAGCRRSARLAWEALMHLFHV